MRILVVHNYYKIPGGEDSVFENEAKLLRDRGNEVTEYTRHNRDMGIKELIFEAPYSRKTYREIRQIIREKDIEIVHVHNDRFLISPSVFRAAKDEGVPVVRTLHNFRLICINAMLIRGGKVCRECIEDGTVRILPALKYGCFRNSRILTFLNLRINRSAVKRRAYDGVRFIALTEFNRDIFLSAGLCAKEDIFVKPNFTFKPEITPDKETIKPGFLYLGRIDPLKGIEDILKEWQKLPESFVLKIAGTGEAGYEKSLRDKYEAPNIRFMGKLSHDEAMKELKASKALLFASRLYEGFPMTIIESFSLGTPVIGLDFGNGGSIISSIYSRKEPLLKDIGELSGRVESFDEDLKTGLYGYDEGNLASFLPDRNYHMLMEIYEKCLRS